MNALTTTLSQGLGLDPATVHQVIVPLVIFCARICDVSIGTLRIIIVSRGRKGLATFLGFWEVLIWLAVISQVMQNLDSAWHFIAYASGYAAGNYVGILIEEKMALGHVMVRVIARQDATPLIDHLRSHSFGVTSIAAHGVTGEVRLVFSVVQRQDLAKALDLIRQFNPRAFVSVEDVRSVAEGVFPDRPVRGSLRSFLPLRK
jgi:uncharacterized protein YebE (UPF0316 family)